MLEPVRLLDLMAGGWRRLTFTPFRDRITIHRLYGDALTGPAAALLRYAPGGRVPLHEHQGHEHVIVLDGAQADDHGACSAGGMVVSPPGSRHAVHSPEGCVALLIWQAPIRFL